MDSKYLCSLLLIALAVVGCGAPGMQVTTTDDYPVVDLVNPQTPPPIEEFRSPFPTLVRAADVLELRVFDFGDLSGSYTVSSDGKINLPMIGSMDVAGKTVGQLDDQITEALSEHFRYIDVAINLEKRAPRYVYILGEVKKAGRIELEPGDRVLHVLAAAGGMTDKARENDVILLRRMSDGTDRAFRLRFHQIFKGIAPQDFYVKQNDVIFVPKGRFQTFTDYSQSILDNLSRASTSVLTIDAIINIRNRTLSVR